jgi:hypothetical protein
LLIGLVGADLRQQLFLKAALGLLDALGARARHGPRLLVAPALQAPPGLAQPCPAAFTCGQLFRQLVAARVAIKLILGGVDRLGLFNDLARQLLVVDVRVATGVGVDLGAVDRDDRTLASPDRAQSSKTSPNSPASAVS